MRVTHRFHPWYGREFEFVVHRQNWGEDRVHLRDRDGRVFSLPTAGPSGTGRSVRGDRRGALPVQHGGLLALADLIDGLRAQPRQDRAVKEITP